MRSKHRPTFVAVAFFVTALSCGNEETRLTGTGGTAAPGSGGASGGAGANAAAGTTGNAGTTGEAGTTGNGGTGQAGTSGGGGTSATGGATGHAGTGGAGAAGRGGTTGSGGAAGGAGAAGAAGTLGRGGAGGNAGRGGSMGGSAGGTGGGASGRGGAGGSTGGAAGSGGSNAGDAVRSSGCGTTGWPTTKEGYALSVDGMDRTYNLRIPDNYDNTRAYRLIVSYHWADGTANNISMGSGQARPWYGLWDLAQGSTIFVAPQGVGNRWSDTGRSRTTGGQDIKFTTALVNDLSAKLCIDKSRIFAEGHSMGGSMSYAVACALPDVFRGVVVHSGGPMSGCVTHSKPVAYFMTHGTQDNICTYPEYGVPQLNDFASVNGCASQSLPTPSSSAGTCVDFMGCMSGYPTRACIFVGGHTPAPPSLSTSWVPAEAWKFVSQF